MYYNTQTYEFINKNKRDYIKEHLLECYTKILTEYNSSSRENSSIESFIRSHKRLINIMDLNCYGKNKNKYKTLTYLQHYRNTKNKAIAISIFTNTMNKLGLLHI